jgi:hypothetical protein
LYTSCVLSGAFMLLMIFAYIYIYIYIYKRIRLFDQEFTFLPCFIQICFQIGGLGSKPDFGSIYQISGWWMEMFTGRCGDI